ncbi:hypothetical protein BESB_055700 [Besnoitia besnoiti]|uniref:Magnesium transporter NIPA n=1 Tax=Besnoitia besnoiti TaxID=94643 RepID=A0A2A9MDG7_BESBE|nr:hypothetical protein BESB_055700 [Besnoitia besnoiti]PFH35919.1 hypothetical protein BESB_055700 [Besnoitia besnoiti]
MMHKARAGRPACSGQDGCEAPSSQTPASTVSMRQMYRSLPASARPPPSLLSASPSSRTLHAFFSSSAHASVSGSFLPPLTVCLFFFLLLCLSAVTESPLAPVGAAQRRTVNPAGDETPSPSALESRDRDSASTGIPQERDGVAASVFDVGNALLPQLEVRHDSDVPTDPEGATEGELAEKWTWAGDAKETGDRAASPRREGSDLRAGPARISRLPRGEGRDRPARRTTARVPAGGNHLRHTRGRGGRDGSSSFFESETAEHPRAEASSHLPRSEEAGSEGRRGEEDTESPLGSAKSSAAYAGPEARTSGRETAEETPRRLLDSLPWSPPARDPLLSSASPSSRPSSSASGSSAGRPAGVSSGSDSRTSLPGMSGRGDAQDGDVQAEGAQKSVETSPVSSLAGGFLPDSGSQAPSEKQHDSLRSFSSLPASTSFSSDLFAPKAPSRPQRGSSAPGDPPVLEIPASVLFVVGIIVSVLGTILSALGDVCIRFSFVRQAASAPGSSPPVSRALSPATPETGDAEDGESTRHPVGRGAPMEGLAILPLPPTSGILAEANSSPSLAASPRLSSSLSSSSASASCHRGRGAASADARGILDEALLPAASSGVRTPAVEEGEEMLPPRRGRQLSEATRPPTSSWRDGEDRFLASASSSFIEFGGSEDGDELRISGEVEVAAPCECRWDSLWAFGVFCSCVVSPVLSVVSLSLLPANITGFAALQIFFVVILARLMLGEVVHKVNLAGGVLVVAGLVTLTACAAPEPPLPDTATLARQLVSPAAIIFESVCSVVVVVGLSLLLLVRPEKASPPPAPAPSPEVLVFSDPPGLPPAEEKLREARAALAESPQGGARAAEGGGFDRLGRGCLSSAAESVASGRDRPEGLADLCGEGGEPEGFGASGGLAEAESKAEGSLVHAAIPLLHHMFLPATAGVLGAVASISIKLIQAFFLSFSSACLPPSSSAAALLQGSASLSLDPLPATSVSVVASVFDMLLCLVNPVFLFHHIRLPLLFVLTAAAALLELLFLSQMLRYYPASESVPLMDAVLTVFTGLGGVIIFNEPPKNPWGWATGLAFLVLGVVVLGFGGKIWSCMRKAAKAWHRFWLVRLRRPRTAAAASAGRSVEPHRGPLGPGLDGLEPGDPRTRRARVSEESEGLGGLGLLFGWIDASSWISAAERRREAVQREDRPCDAPLEQDDGGGGEKRGFFAHLLEGLAKRTHSQHSTSVQTPENSLGTSREHHGLSEFQALTDEEESRSGRRRDTVECRRPSMENPLLLRSEQELRRL